MSRATIPASLEGRASAFATLDDGGVVIDADDEPKLSEYRDIVLDNKWFILGVALLPLVIALAYVILATPVFRANVLVQIEDSAPESKSLLNAASGLFDLKTPAAGELQVLSSRMVLGAAVDQVKAQVTAQPRYLPLLGAWLGRRAKELSSPGFLVWPGYVTGAERIGVERFDVPTSLEDSDPFIVTAESNGRFSIRHEMLDSKLQGMVGQTLRHTLPDGVIEIRLNKLEGNPGAEFEVSVSSRLQTIEQLQGRLQLGEQGRQSNVISVGLEESDRERLVTLLNAIGDQYVRQNMERKSAEAEKTLAFLDAQLPQFQRQLEASENAFARFRNQRGTVAFDEEAKVWLKRSTDLEASLLDLQQRRRDLDTRFTGESTQVQTLDRQIAAVQSELSGLGGRLAGMPNVQRDALRLERDVRVNSALYQSLQNNALQLRLVKEGKIGNVRVLDRAVLPKRPVKPQKALVVAFALVLGLLLGPAVAVLRTRLRSGLRNPDEIEAYTGLNVLGVVPFSPLQAQIDYDERKKSGGRLLADVHPRSAPVEALRGLRVGLKTMMSEATNNRILVTGATQGIGKSFIATNFAMLLAQAGKRVLLINADLRKGNIGQSLGLGNVGGLSEVLRGRLDLRDAIHAQVRQNLDVLVAGKPPALPVDMLESEDFRRLLDILSARYDSIIIDTAPVLVAADAAAVAPACGVVLLVARADRSQIGEINESIRRLSLAGSATRGVVFNGMDLTRRYVGSYSYGGGAYRYRGGDYGYAN